MRPSNRLPWHWLGIVLATTVGALVQSTIARGQPVGADPVERLRQVLQTSGDAADRNRSTRECLDGLKSLADLRRALLLTEWRDRNLESTYGAVDLANRAIVAERFQQVFRQVFSRHEATSAVVAIGMLADMATTTRQAGEPVNFLRPFGADLADLVQHAPPKVQIVAARTLGLINPDVAVAAPALGALLQSNDPNLRCAAAEGLYEVLRSYSRGTVREGMDLSIANSRTEIIVAACTVLPVAGRAMGDWHVEVRRRCVGTIGLGAASLAGMIVDPPSATAGDAADIPEQVRGVRDAIRPLALALRDQEAALTKALRDGDTEVRLLAQRALEDVASARARWVRLGGAALASDDPLVEGLIAALPALSDAAGDADLRVRRAAVDVLGVLGPASAPAVPALVRALRDSDRFVRWSAIRTLGTIGPSATRASLPALTLLLDDEDLDVRKAAAETIQRLNYATGTGPVPATTVSRATVTHTAVPALVRSVRSSDPEMRVAALQTLRGMGPEMKQALPVLREALGDSDARVRQAAAEALGVLGPLARDAADDLRTAMNDGAPGVRQAAGEALLNVLRSSTH